MNLSEIKNKLNKLQNKGESKKTEKFDYSTVYWKPTPGKHVIRIVQSKFDKDNPFREVFFHYGLTKAPIMALSNFGEKDPVMEFATALRKSGDPDNINTAKKLYPKMRVFVPVLVRGEEEKGVRLWEFGKSIYVELLAMAEDEDIEDYTDIVSGRDFLVTKISPEEDGSLYGSTSIRPKTKTSPLSTKEEEITRYLEEQPDIFELYKRYDFDSLKEVLLKWLEPSEDSNTDEKSSNYKLEGKPSKSDEFDSLFQEQEVA